LEETQLLYFDCDHEMHEITVNFVKTPPLSKVQQLQEENHSKTSTLIWPKKLLIFRATPRTNVNSDLMGAKMNISYCGARSAFRTLIRQPGCVCGNVDSWRRKRKRNPPKCAMQKLPNSKISAPQNDNSSSGRTLALLGLHAPRRSVSWTFMYVLMRQWGWASYRFFVVYYVGVILLIMHCRMVVYNSVLI
jgi:hypothetical protein